MENNTETDINYTLGSPFKMLDGENTANSSIFFPVFSDADNTIKYIYTVKKIQMENIQEVFHNF